MHDHDYYLLATVASHRLSIHCTGSSSVKSLFHNLCIDTTIRWQQLGILELDDEAEAEAYAFLGEDLSDCFRSLVSWLHCMRCIIRIQHQYLAIRVQHRHAMARHSAFVQTFARIQK